MKTLIKFFVFLLSVHFIFGNDGTFLSNGSVIYPINETKISLEKEILSFKCKDRTASVNVYFEFNNPENYPIKSLVGFVSPFYNYDLPENNKPEKLIRKFFVVVNDKILPYTKKWSQCDTCQLNDFSNQLNEEDMSGQIIHLFEVEFRPGINRISHSYEFSASSYVYLDEIYTYVLETGKKWAGGKIKDFTLEIDCGDNQLIFIDDIFGKDAEWAIVGSGRICNEKIKEDVFEDYDIRLVRIISGSLKIQAKNLSPERNVYFGLIDNTWFVSRMFNKGKFSEDFLLALSDIKYDDFYREIQLNPKEIQLLRNLLYAQYNYDFKNKEYKDFFSQFDWYMPDPNLKMEDIKFSETHKKCLKRIIELEKIKK
ncbi:MAG: YARHG domain-containing protein [Candidatus Kapabacteria bacterium]|nr:YARHG domain-containing protein [Candidatus Kapabacteria bacterium]